MYVQLRLQSQPTEWLMTSAYKHNNHNLIIITSVSSKHELEVELTGIEFQHAILRLPVLTCCCSSAYFTVSAPFQSTSAYFISTVLYSDAFNYFLLPISTSSHSECVKKNCQHTVISVSSMMDTRESVRSMSGEYNSLWPSNKSRGPDSWCSTERQRASPANKTHISDRNI